MSGSPSSSGGYDWPSSPSDNCDISLVTTLNSPNLAVIGQLSVGDILDVVPQNSDGRNILAVLNTEGEIVGVITATQAVTILSCISKGHTYQAVVNELNSPICRVEVSMVS